MPYSSHSIERRADRVCAGSLPETLGTTLCDLIVPPSRSGLRHQRVLQYAPRYRIALTLLNEDVSGGDAPSRWAVDTNAARECDSQRHLTMYLAAVSC